MSKVIAIIEKPKNCDYCPFGICKYSLPLSTNRKGYYCQLKKDRTVEDFEFNEDVHLRDCPLKELPEKKEPDSSSDSLYFEARGWNACIDKILKGSEENDRV